MRLIKYIHPFLTAVTIAACVSSCGGDDNAEGADGGTTDAEDTTSTTAPSTTAPSTTAPSTTSVDETTMGPTGTGTGTDTDTDTDTETETDTEGPYALAPSDKSASEDLLDVEAAPGTTTTIGFTWNETAGWPAATDLSVHVAGNRDPLVQVFTSAGTPFVRAGLEVVPLQAGTEYQLAVTLGHDQSANVQVRHGEDVIVEQTIALPKKLVISGLELRMPSANMLAAPVGLADIAVE